MTLLQITSYSSKTPAYKYKSSDRIFQILWHLERRGQVEGSQKLSGWGPKFTITNAQFSTGIIQREYKTAKQEYKPINFKVQIFQI